MQSLLLKSVRDWFVSIHPAIECVYGEQQTIPPALEGQNFAVLRVVDMSRQGIDGTELLYSETEDKFSETAFSVKEIVISLEVFTVDNSAEDIINQALVSLVTQASNDVFSENGFSVLMYDESRNLSSTISARYARRFQSDIHFGVNISYTNPIDRVASVPFLGVVSGEEISGEVTT